MIDLYTYSIASDITAALLDLGQLVQEIQNSAIVTALDLDLTRSDGDVLSVVFKDTLSAGDKTLLDNDTTGPSGGIIGAHTGIGLADAPQAVTLSNRSAEDGTLIMIPEIPVGSEKYFYLPNICDPCAWYHNSTVVSQFSMTDSGNGLLWNTSGTHLNWVDMKHGRVFQEDKHVIVTPTLLVLVELSTDAGSNWNPLVEDTDFTVDYPNGTITCIADQTGNLIRASFHKSPDEYYFTIQPEPGKLLKLNYVEVQISKDAHMESNMYFEVWGYNPYDLPNKVMYDYEVYKTTWDLIQESTGPFPSLPPFGGSSALGQNTRGCLNEVITIPFHYLARRDIKSSLGMGVRVKIPQPWSGEFANATFYCLSEDE